MCLLRDVKQSGFEATLLVDPVDDFAVRGVAADGFAQELADSSVIVMYRRHSATPSNSPLVHPRAG